MNSILMACFLARRNSNAKAIQTDRSLTIYHPYFRHRRWEALERQEANSSFDNIPLTALALKQGGYDWGFLAYAVGFGGSMIWFGSSAGVALSNLFPEAKSVALWLKHSWYIPIAYVIGFFVLLLTHDWHPNEPHKLQSAAPASHAGLVPELNTDSDITACPTRSLTVA